MGQTFLKLQTGKREMQINLEFYHAAERYHL
jgi:hypothetical protein